MPHRAFAIAVLAAVAAGAGCPRGASGPAASGPSTPSAVVTAARATLEQWRQAHEIRSFDALAKLYLREIDLIVIHEGVAVLGWSAVEAMLKERLGGSAIHVRLRDVHVSALGPDAAAAVATMSRERTEGTTTVQEQGTLSLALRRTDGEWVIVVEHYSYKRS
jgi:ketosteroid isomerase-like protein